MLTNVQEPEASPVGRISPETGAQPGASLRASVDRLPRFSSQEPLEWWHQLPELVSGRLRLREVGLSDAPSLTAVLGAAEVAQHLSPGLDAPLRK